MLWTTSKNPWLALVLGEPLTHAGSFLLSSLASVWIGRHTRKDPVLPARAFGMAGVLMRVDAFF